MIRQRPWTLRPPTESQADWHDLWPQLTAAARVARNGGGGGGAISADVYKLLQVSGVFGALVSEERGGFGLDPLEALTLIEDMAAIDGALGWLTFAGTVGGIFSVELPPAGAAEVYATADHLVAYAGGINGIATRTDGGVKVSGTWRMATGVSHAAWVAVGCTIEGIASSETAVVLLPRSMVSIGEYWSPIGLPGTGTASLSVRDAAVPDRLVALDTREDQANRQRRRHRCLVPAAIAAVAVGIGTAALDAAAAWFALEQPAPQRTRRADSEVVQDRLGTNYAHLLAARSFLREVASEAWQLAAEGHELSLELAARLRLAATHAAHAGAQAAEEVGHLAGVASVTNEDALSARWLDARTVLANITVSSIYYGIYGGVAADGVIPRSWP